MTQQQFFPSTILLTEPDPHCLESLNQLLSNEAKLDKVHISENKQEPGICIHYNPDIISLEQIKALVELAGSKISDRYQHEMMTIQDMDNPDCAIIIESELKKLDGVLAAKVSYMSQQLRLEYDKESVALKDIIKKLKKIGYPVLKEKVEESWLN